MLLKAGRREQAKAAFRRSLELAPSSEFGKAAREHLKAHRATALTLSA